MEAAVNSMLGWLYREIDLTSITVPIWRSPVRPSESYDWMLERIQAEYDSDAEDPSTFALTEWRLQVPPQDRNLSEVTIPISLTLNSGIHDLTAATTRPKQYFFESPRIDWPIRALENFTIEIQNITTTGVLRLLFIGHFIFPEPVIV